MTHNTQVSVCVSNNFGVSNLKKIWESLSWENKNIFLKYVLAYLVKIQVSGLRNIPKKYDNNRCQQAKETICNRMSKRGRVYVCESVKGSEYVCKMKAMCVFVFEREIERGEIEDVIIVPDWDLNSIQFSRAIKD